MIENEKHLRDILSVLQEEDVLNNVILIGSWCLLFFKYLFNDYNPTVRTTDIDFYVPDVKSFKTKYGLVDSLKEINYDIIQDALTHKSSFISPDGFELEFLTKLNRYQLACVKLGNTGIYAESLSFVDIFSWNYIEFDYQGLKVKTASPATYILQKLLVNKFRKQGKAEKDVESIKNLLNYVKVNKQFNNELINLFNTLPKKWKKTILETASKNNIVLFD